MIFENLPVIGIVAPGKPHEEFEVSLVKENLIRRGFKVKTAHNLSNRRGYLADTDEIRAREFMSLWLDKEVEIVWCFAGGYGTTRILPLLDFDLIKANPKPLIGFSDVTALHCALHKKCSFPSFLGSNLFWLFRSETDYTIKELLRVLSERSLFGVQKCSFIKQRNHRSQDSNSSLIDSVDQENQEAFLLCENKEDEIIYPESFSLPRGVIVQGEARGVLVGGNLTLITSLIGTPWELETDGKILLLEEVNEEPYRIDRMLFQLKASGALDHIKGVILASFAGCDPRDPTKSLALEEVFRDYFSEAIYPAAYGFPSGHILETTTLVIGGEYELRVDETIHLRLVDQLPTRH